MHLKFFALRTVYHCVFQQHSFHMPGVQIVSDAETLTCIEMQVT